MPTPQVSALNPDATLDEVKDYIVGQMRYLNYLLSTLDTQNINRLDAKVIIAGTITALQIAANSITADKMSVSELSAIAANLGTITAGIIYGAYIATANGTYPRIELSSINSLLKAFLDATNYIAINPGVSPFQTRPTFEFVSPDANSRIGNNSFFIPVFEMKSDVIIGISSDQDIQLTASSGNVSAESAAGSISDIVTAILARAISGSTTSSEAVSDSHNHGLSSSDYIQTYDSGGTPTGFKQWNPYAGSAPHSHTI